MDRTAIEIKNCYIDFGIPVIPGFPYPVTVRAGGQPFGPRGYIMGAVDATGVTVGINADPVTIIPMWAKGWEGQLQAADDVDLYGLEMNVKVSTFKVGGYGLYLNANTFPFARTNQVEVLPAGSGPNPFGTFTTNSWNAYMWWFGLYADGKAGPADLNLDFIYNHGKVKANLSQVAFSTAAPDVKYTGWMARGKIDFPWEKFNFGAVGVYGAGSDARKTSTKGLPGDAVAEVASSTTSSTAPASAARATKVKGFVNMPSGETGSLGDIEVLGPSYVNGGTGSGGIGYSNTGGAFGRGSTGGIWYAKLYGAVKAAPWYKITLQGIYIADTTDHGNTFGTARQADKKTLRDDKDIGWEFDMIHEIEIYKNLVYRISAGVLFAGDALDFYDATSGIERNRKLKNPFALHTCLTYTF